MANTLRLVSGFLQLTLLKFENVTRFDVIVNDFFDNAFATYQLFVDVVLGIWVVPSHSRSYLVTPHHFLIAYVQFRVCHPGIEFFAPISWLLSIHPVINQWHPSLRLRISYPNTCLIGWLNYFLRLRLLLLQELLLASLVGHGTPLEANPSFDLNVQVTSLSSEFFNPVECWM